MGSRQNKIIEMKCTNVTNSGMEKNTVVTQITYRSFITTKQMTTNEMDGPVLRYASTAVRTQAELSKYQWKVSNNIGCYLPVEPTATSNVSFTKEHIMEQNHTKKRVASRVTLDREPDIAEVGWLVDRI